MLGLVVGTLSLLFVVQSLAPPMVYSKDFSQEYLLARAIRDGVDPYLPVRELAERFTAPIGFMDKTHPTPHPPTLGLLVLPLAFVSYPTAAVVWFGVELLCVLATVYLLARAVDAELPARAVPIVGLIAVAWPAVVLELGLGQLMIPILAALAAAQLLLVRSHSLAGGAMLGLTFLIKPIAWPWLIVLAAQRDWRAILAAAVVTCVGYVISGVVIGVDSLVGYFVEVLPALSASMASERTNISVWVLGPRVAGGALVPALVALAFAAWLVRARPPLLAGLAVATALSAVLSPIAWQFYIVIAALPMAYLLALIARRGFKPLHVLASLCIAVLLGISYHQWLSLAEQTQGNLVLLGPSLGVALLALLIARLGFER